MFFKISDNVMVLVDASLHAPIISDGIYKHLLQLVFMKYKWIFVKNDKGEYKKIKCFILEENKIEKPKYTIVTTC